MKKRILSGIQATGKLHLGNYFGAMKQFVDMQNDENECFYFVANLHSLNSVFDPKLLAENTRDVVLDFLAIGIDPDKSLIYLQSDIPEHTELTWFFNCLVTPAFLERAHSFKDKEAKGLEINMGLYDYPVLMAADILLYSPDYVPVGQDQKQHVEYTRDIADKFNFIYKTDTFNKPEAMILNDVAVVPGIDGDKMSKSYNNHIPLFATDDEIRSLCARVVTDSRRPEEVKDVETSTILKIYKLVASESEYEALVKRFESEGEEGIGYKEAKDKLAEAIISYVGPFRERRKYYEERPELVREILEKSKSKVRAMAQAKMKEVRKATGII
jgi:tryptophanyl-tRNA synthetase